MSGRTAAGGQVLDMDALLRRSQISGAHRHRIRRNAGNVAGQAKHTTQRVVGQHLWHGRHIAGSHGHQLIHGFGGEGFRVDGTDAAGPAHGGVGHIRTTLCRDQVGVALCIVLRPEMDLLHGHPQMLLQAEIEIAHEVAGAAVGALPGGHLTLLVGVFIQEENMYIFAADLVLVQRLHTACSGLGRIMTSFSPFAAARRMRQNRSDAK